VLLRKDMGLGEAEGTAAQGGAHRAGGVSNSLGNVPTPPLMQPAPQPPAPVIYKCGRMFGRSPRQKIKAGKLI